MKYIKSVLTVLFILITYAVYGQVLDFHVVSFQVDAFDMTAKNELYREIDGSGSLYAIIKVSSQTPNDDVSAYQFHFGMMNHKVKNHNGEIWVYVQKNAKTMTISRNGYKTLSKYDLGTTIEEGKTYNLVLSAQAPVVYTQMVMFQMQPAIPQATIMIRSEERPDAYEEIFGITDNTGGVAKSMEYGTYTYRVMAENYYPSEGRFTLSNQNETHREDVILRSNGADITLLVDADAEIYINNNKKGIRSWKGVLKAGRYQIECRQKNHNPSSQTITVVEGENHIITLTPPQPITGVLALTSTPLGASIKIDGKDYGTTPRNITNLLIGQHNLTLSHKDYHEEKRQIEITELQTTALNINMIEKKKMTANVKLEKGNESTGEHFLLFTINDIKFKMIAVEGGTFRMGSNSNESTEYERPVHKVTLSSYYIGQTEVTQSLWTEVMGSNPSKHKGNDDVLPADNMSWEECQVFVDKLSQMTGYKFRLPTEAEWEFAARGGNKSNGYKYSGSDNFEDVAWTVENSGNSHIDTNGSWWNEAKIQNCRPHPVARKQPNELNLYDMSGNVAELCQDRGAFEKYPDEDLTNPQGPLEGVNRRYRGGSWEDSAFNSRTTWRGCNGESSRAGFIGFRLALSE